MDIMMQTGAMILKRERALLDLLWIFLECGFMGIEAPIIIAQSTAKAEYVAAYEACMEDKASETFLLKFFLHYQ